MSRITENAHGLLVIDKPEGLTSRAVVNRLQSVFRPGTRLGHTGTLDPLATGVLVVCVGAACRLSEYVQRMEKTYEARFRLGARSTTDDREGVMEEVSGAQPPQENAILQALQSFVGETAQIPPAFSAAKTTGRRAYDLARSGREVSLNPRIVYIRSLDLKTYHYPWLDIEVSCGKGTYIRSLARDLGERLGCGALVQSLRRTRVGVFDQALAQPLENADPARSLLPFHYAVAELARVNLHESEVLHVRQGRRIPWPASFQASSLNDLAAFDAAGILVAVLGVDDQEKTLFPKKVLPNSDLADYT
jgi:tRNA pseudouridine55 synthase